MILDILRSNGIRSSVIWLWLFLSLCVKLQLFIQKAMSFCKFNWNQLRMYSEFVLRLMNFRNFPINFFLFFFMPPNERNELSDWWWILIGMEFDSHASYIFDSYQSKRMMMPWNQRRNQNVNRKQHNRMLIKDLLVYKIILSNSLSINVDNN